MIIDALGGRVGDTEDLKGSDLLALAKCMKFTKDGEFFSSSNLADFCAHVLPVVRSSQNQLSRCQNIYRALANLAFPGSFRHYWQQRWMSQRQFVALGHCQCVRNLAARGGPTLYVHPTLSKQGTDSVYSCRTKKKQLSAAGNFKQIQRRQ